MRIAGELRPRRGTEPSAPMYEFAVVREAISVPCTFGDSYLQGARDAQAEAKRGDMTSLIVARTAHEAVEAFIAATGEQPHNVTSPDAERYGSYKTSPKTVARIEIRVTGFKQVNP